MDDGLIIDRVADRLDHIFPGRMGNCLKALDSQAGLAASPALPAASPPAVIVRMALRPVQGRAQRWITVFVPSGGIRAGEVAVG
ncbi:MAG TPA: hypothetical protein VIQ29_11225 [Ancylobacter sp.]